MRSDARMRVVLADRSSTEKDPVKSDPRQARRHVYPSSPGPRAYTCWRHQGVNPAAGGSNGEGTALTRHAEYSSSRLHWAAAPRSRPRTARAPTVRRPPAEAQAKAASPRPSPSDICEAFRSAIARGGTDGTAPTTPRPLRAEWATIPHHRSVGTTMPSDCGCGSHGSPTRRMCGPALLGPRRVRTAFSPPAPAPGAFALGTSRALP